MSKESTIKVRLKAFTDDAAKKIKSFVASVKTRAAGLRDAFSSVFSVGGLIAGGGIIAGLGLIFKSSVKAAAGFEQTRIAYETMLGSASKAESVLNDLTKFSTVTPFEPDEVYAAGRVLLAFGEDASSLIGTLRMLGDVSAGTGKPLNELVAIYGKIRTKGKAQAEELNMLAEAGIPIIQTLAKMYGKTGDEIYKMASEGKLGFAEIKAAFGEMTAEGSQFGGMMEKQSESMTGIWSTLAGNIKEVGKSLGNALLPELKKIALVANDLAKDLTLIAQFRSPQGRADAGILTREDARAKAAAAIENDYAKNPGYKAEYDRKVSESQAQNTWKNKFKELAARFLGGVDAESAKTLSDPVAKVREEEIQSRMRKMGFKGNEDFITAPLDSKVVEADRDAERKAKADKEAAEAKQKADAEQRVLDTAAAKTAAAEKKKLDDIIEGMQDKLHYQQLILKGKEREAAIDEALDKALKATEASGLTEENRQKVADLAGAQYDLAAAAEQRKQALSLYNTPESLNITDSVLKIGGMHGGQSDQSVDIQKRLANITEFIKQRVELIEQKTPWKTSGDTSGNWR